MMGYKQVKAKTAIGTTKKVSGEIEVLRGKGDEPPSFRNLQKNLKGKILVCSGEISKSVLEKAKALGVLGVVGSKIADEQLSCLKSELKTSWSPSLFALLIVEEGIEKVLDKIEGKMGTIEVEKKRLVIEA